MADYNHLGVGVGPSFTLLSSTNDSYLGGFQIRSDLQDTQWFITGTALGPTFSFAAQFGDDNSQMYQVSSGYRAAGNLLFFGFEAHAGGKFFSSYTDNTHNETGFAGYISAAFTLFDAVIREHLWLPTIIAGFSWCWLWK